MDQALIGHPLRPAFLYRTRLEAVRRQAVVDGQAIDPWHLAAVLEGLRLRMDHALRIIDRGMILDAARHALHLHAWADVARLRPGGRHQACRTALTTFSRVTPFGSMRADMRNLIALVSACQYTTPCNTGKAWIASVRGLELPVQAGFRVDARWKGWSMLKYRTATAAASWDKPQPLIPEPGLVAKARPRRHRDPDKSNGDGLPRHLSLALQGGGFFGAFTWGVLDRLLQEQVSVDAVSGASAGAINAVLLASGVAEGGPKAARAKLERFWRHVSQVASSQIAMEAAIELAQHNVSLYVFNPLGINPLRDSPDRRGRLRPAVYGAADPAADRGDPGERWAAQAVPRGRDHGRCGSRFLLPAAAASRG